MPMKIHWLSFHTCLLLSLLGLGLAHEDDAKYNPGDEVTLWVNKVGPYHNPQETYAFYSLPFCIPKGKELKQKSDSIGAALDGNELRDSGILIRFKDDVTDAKLCEIEFTEEVAEVFTDAVKNHYWYQLYLDELPMWGMVGQMEGSAAVPGSSNVAGGAEVPNLSSSGNARAFFYTHKAFSISYNQNHIIQVNLTSANPKPIEKGKKEAMTYSVTWTPTDGSFEDRFDRYLDFSFFEHQIHWFSIFNSFMMVVFLCGLVVLILMRTLKNDYMRYTSEDEDLELDRVIDESGWKQVHGDVFRPPPYLMLYSALIGTGHQLVALVFCGTLLAIARSLYVGRGAVINALLLVYSVTSFVAGYAGSRYYKRNGGMDWKLTMMMTAVLFPGVCFCVSFVLNFIAVAYQSTAAINFFIILKILALWGFISLPLVVAGTVIGRNTVSSQDVPCRVNALKRPIPDHKWYTHPVVLSLAGGILPFGSIFIEMYFIFTSFWNYKFYYVYGFMLLVYLILIIVTVCVTIVSTYILLNAEDYRWQWCCFFSGGSTALYVYLYAFYYFFTKTKMYGFFQVSFYFGYMGLFSFGLFILCGTIGYMGTSIFVNKIYQYIKSD